MAYKASCDPPPTNAPASLLVTSPLSGAHVCAQVPASGLVSLFRQLPGFLLLIA